MGWAGAGFAKGKTSTAGAPPADATADTAAPAADSNAVPADSTPPAPGDETVTPEGGDETQLPLEPEAGKAKQTTTLSWQDIVVVPRKAFIKGGRFEFAPFSGVSVNDNLIRHYAFGGSITYFLSDALSVGLEGQYYIKALSPTAENVGLEYNRIPTLNRYLYSGALDFGYVPVYGKFALFNKQILHWEIYATAGVGLMVSEILPRDPGLSAFKNQLLMVPVGLGSRFFLFNWLTVNFAIKDYIFADKFEPADREMNPALADAAAAKANADSALVNNVMFYAGVGLYLPTKFTYKTPR
ncbi:MAG TPA: outer membrane beta-barrel domain-containing protein [Polyangia bacterium]|nr:outer membrane beta-barrel domain-containing protein [Polyangia bacterium]